MPKNQFIKRSVPKSFLDTSKIFRSVAPTLVFDFQKVRSNTIPGKFRGSHNNTNTV